MKVRAAVQFPLAVMIYISALVFLPPAQALVFQDDQANHVVAPGDWSGVGRLDNCSAVLLWTGIDVLTAAHCGPSANVVFNLPSGGSVSVGVSSFTAHPLYTGSLSNGFDLAMIRLSTPAPVTIARYDIYTSSNEYGQVADLVSYGGVGSGGVYSGGFPSKRAGQNVYEAYGIGTTNVFAGPMAPDGRILFADFDNGNPANDAFGIYLGLNNLGLGNQEAMSASGDSGGPVFINGQIAGIHSFAARFGDLPGNINSDIDNSVNFSTGELFGDTRVSYFATWIQGLAVPEPSTIMLLALGLLAIVLLGQRRKGRRRVFSRSASKG